MIVLRAFLAFACVAGLILSGSTRGHRLRVEARESSAPATIDAPAGRYFSARLAIQHWRFSVSGARLPVGGPPVAMRVVRELRRGRWVTALSVDREPGALIDEPGRRTRLVNPFRVARMEMADDEPFPRMFDRAGRPVRALTPADLRLVGAAAAIRPSSGSRQAAASPGGVFLAAGSQRAVRRAALVRQFGRSTGRVGGLDRFARADANGRHEVLVTTDTALPVLVSTTAAAGGEIRTNIDWEPRERDGFIRRLMRTEHRPAGSAAGRSVVEVSLSEVELSGEVQP